ncbi:hypothetical protein BH10ACT2_BH10ACT2_21350 [soil metagenome]
MIQNVRHEEAPTPWFGVWRSGPDAGAAIELPIGRHLVGRAHTAGVRCDDHTLEPHHALVEVGADGWVNLTQLTGRTPIRVDGQVVDVQSADGATSLTDAAEVAVDVGTSTLVLLHNHGRKQPAYLRDGAVMRAPRAVPEFQASELAGPGEAPMRGENSGGLLPAVLGLAGAGAIAMLLGQPMFLLFGALGATVAIGSWVAQRVAMTRKFRIAFAEFERARTAHDEHLIRERSAFRRHLLAAVPTVDRAVCALVERDATLWTRRGSHRDAYIVAIGMDPVEHDLPSPADVGPGCRMALLGPYGNAVARSIVVQLAASCGPADLRITIVTDNPDRWNCVRAFPNTTLPDGSAAIVSEGELPRVLDDLAARTVHGGHHLLITDQPALLATRTSPLRRATSDVLRDALIVVLPAGDSAGNAAVPHICSSVLTTTSGPWARWVPDVNCTMLPQQVRLVGVGERTTARCALSMSGLIDPEDALSIASVVPRQLSLAALLQREANVALTPVAIAASWAANGSDPPPRTVIGMAADGVVDIDLVRDGPHGLIAGTTGSGKSEFLRSLVAGMAAAVSPTYLTFVLIDYKGGATFDACAALPHVVGMVTDLDDQLADRALRSLHAELRRREAMLRDHGAADLSELRAKAPSVTMPRLVVVIDEFAALVAEQPTFLHALVGVAQRGRSLGVHLLLATQRPSGVITDDIRANTNLRLALRLQDTADSIDVVGIAAPAHLPRGVPGRAILRLGADDHLEFQTAQCTVTSEAGRDSELSVMVHAICEAARLAEIAVPTSPWMPPLPTVLNGDGLGLVDEPDLQRTMPLRWSIADGRLAVLGSAGSGVTSTLLTLADQTLSAHDQTDVYVIDARGDARWADLELHPRCVAVVGLHQRERLQRLLDRLRQQSQFAATSATTTLLIVDGLDALRRALDDLNTSTEYEVLEVLLADASGGMSIVAGAESAAQLPMAFLNRCPARWVLHLHDAHDAALLGVAATHVPPAVPGRIAIAGSDSMAQLVAPRERLGVASADSTVSAATPITVVPPRIGSEQLPKSFAIDGVSSLYLGIDFSAGEPFAMEVPDGEHLLLVGTARSGRSLGLGRIAAAWSVAHPTSWVAAITPRRSSFPRHLAARVASDATAVAALLDELTAHLSSASALLVVDDAESVDDASGRLADLAARGTGLCIVAAGRADALRQTYGHWTGVVRRSRLGLIATGGTDLDGDLLSVLVPRRSPVAARPGLWWVADNGAARLMQMAVDGDDAASTERVIATAM